MQGEVTYGARDSMRYDLAEQTVYLFGAASVHYQGIDLSADRIVFSFKNEEAQAFGALDTAGVVAGKPQFVQDGSTIEADSIRYNFKTKQGFDPAGTHTGTGKLGERELEQTAGQRGGP
ncbi:MAG: hypothetical protein IPG11_12135 [Flavobacteriales bacterium]|nr:hypothetical protein [Flavobacteriales bacterium]